MATSTRQQIACAAAVLVALGVAFSSRQISSTASSSPPRTVARQAAKTFRVATWNIRSGMGVRGFSTTSWDHRTLNCTDPAKPVNAWGVGLPQKELEQLKADPAVIALAVQEAWNCGSPAKINSVLEFKGATREQQGVALFARHGFAGRPVYHRIDTTHPRWVVGGRVCFDASCSVEIPMFSTHWGAGPDAEFPEQAEATLTFLRSQPQPHVLMGDLNVFHIDQWNPRVPCTAANSPGRSRTIALVEGAGYIDAWKATQAGEGWTGMTSRRNCGFPSGNLYKRIDYIFPRGLTVVGTKRFARAAPGADSASDHVGVIAELAVQELRN